MTPTISPSRYIDLVTMNCRCFLNSSRQQIRDMPCRLVEDKTKPEFSKSEMNCLKLQLVIVLNMSQVSRTLWWLFCSYFNLGNEPKKTYTCTQELQYLHCLIFAVIFTIKFQRSNIGLTWWRPREREPPAATNYDVHAPSRKMLASPAP